MPVAGSPWKVPRISPRGPGNRCNGCYAHLEIYGNSVFRGREIYTYPVFFIFCLIVFLVCLHFDRPNFSDSMLVKYSREIPWLSPFSLPLHPPMIHGSKHNLVIKHGLWFWLVLKHGPFIDYLRFLFIKIGVFAIAMFNYKTVTSLLIQSPNVQNENPSLPAPLGPPHQLEKHISIPWRGNICHIEIVLW